MAEDKSVKSAECASRCELKYLGCVAKTRTGCVEVLRVCREKCHREA